MHAAATLTTSAPDPFQQAALGEARQLLDREISHLPRRYRNAILLSTATGYALSIGANRVYYGAHFSDRGVYPDCRPEFVESLERALRLGTDDSSLRIIAPFIEMTKGEIVSLGTKLGVPYALTWSCYKGGERHCGVCSSCRERKRAFAEAGVLDPTGYV